MSEKSNEEISLFVRDDVSGRYVFNAEALRALGVDLAKAQAQGFHIKFQNDAVPEFAA